MMIDHFKELNGYAICEIKVATEETHIVIDDHYSFGEFHFFNDVDECMTKFEEIQSNGTKAIVLNNHAVLAKFYEHEIAMRSINLGIQTINYDTKQ